MWYFFLYVLTSVVSHTKAKEPPLTCQIRMPGITDPLELPLSQPSWLSAFGNGKS